MNGETKESKLWDDYWDETEEQELDDDRNEITTGRLGNSDTTDLDLSNNLFHHENGSGPPPLIPGEDCDETEEWDGEEETLEEGTWPWHSSEEEEEEGENGHAEIKDELDDDDELDEREAEEDAESDESDDDDIDIGEVEKLIAMVTKDPLVVPLDAGWRREVVTR